LFALAACGGGDSTDPASASESPAATANLPEIDDNKDDNVFRYSDPSLYVGTYSKTDNPEDTCSAAFGAAMPNEVDIIAMNTTAITFVTDGVQETHPYYYQTVSDPYMYEGIYYDVVCIYAVGSTVSGGQTYDRSLMVCQDIDSYLSCIVAYQRDADYDFSGETIKGTGEPLVNLIKGLME